MHFPSSTTFEEALETLRFEIWPEDEPDRDVLKPAIPRDQYVQWLNLLQTAAQERKAGNPDRAWVLLLEAHGFARYREGLDRGLYLAGPGRTRSHFAEIGKTGGIATRDSRRAKIRDLVQRIAEKHAEQGWSTPEDLEADIKKMGRQCGLSVVPSLLTSIMREPEIAQIAHVLHGKSTPAPPLRKPRHDERK